MQTLLPTALNASLDQREKKFNEINFDNWQNRAGMPSFPSRVLEQQLL